MLFKAVTIIDEELNVKNDMHIETAEGRIE